MKRLKELLKMHREEAKWFNDNGEYIPLFDNIYKAMDKNIKGNVGLLDITESIIICLSVYEVKRDKLSFLMLDMIVDVCRYYSNEMEAEYEDIADLFYELGCLSLENRALLYNYVSKRKFLTLIQ